MAAGLFRTFEVNIQQPNSGSILAGGKWVRLATAADLNGAYTYAAPKITGPAATALANIDGIAPAVGDRVLVKDAATGSRNGIYVVNALGGAGAYELERDFDMSASSEVKGAWFMVLEGTANGGQQFRNTNTGTITLDTTALTFATEATEIVAGAGLTKTGNTIDAVAADTSLTVTADAIGINLATSSGLQISSGLKAQLEATNPSLAVVSSELGVKFDTSLSKGASGLGIAAAAAGDGLSLTSGVLAVKLEATSPSLQIVSDELGVKLGAPFTKDANGLQLASGVAGAGLALASGVLSVNTDRGLNVTGDNVGIATGGITQAMLQQTAAAGSVIYSTTIGDGAATSITVTHSMGKQFCLAQVYDVDTPYAIADCNVKMDSTTATTFEFTTAPATNKRRVVLMAVA